jgi:hypothetical protein
MQPMARVEWVARRRQISDLTGRSVGPADNLVVDHDAHADSGADGDEYHRRDAACQAEPLLADGRQIDVVLNQDGHLKAVADDLDRVEPALGRDVVGERRDPPRALVDDPGGRNRQCQRTAVGGAGAVDDLGDHLQHLHPQGSVSGLCGRLLEVADRLAEQIGGRDAKVAATDVTADHEADLLADHVGHRATSALAGPAPGRPDQPALLEAPDRGRHGGLGQLGGRRDLRPGDRASAEDRLEHGLLPELAEQAEARLVGYVAVLARGGHRASSSAFVSGITKHGVPVRPPQLVSGGYFGLRWYRR